MHSSVVACHGGWHTWVAPAVLPHCCLVEVANLLGIRWVLSLLHPGTAQDHSQVHMWTGQPPDSRRKAGMLHQLHSKPLPSVPSGSLTSGTSSWWLQVPLREGTTLGTSRSPGHALVGDHTAWQAAHGWSGDDPNQAHLSHTHTLTSTTCFTGRELATQNWNHTSHSSAQDWTVTEVVGGLARYCCRQRGAHWHQLHCLLEQCHRSPGLRPHPAGTALQLQQPERTTVGEGSCC